MITDSAVLLDIEGTTTAISFVTDVLFPYAAQAIPDFLAKRGEDPAVRAAADAILADATADERALDRRAAVVAVVRRQMAGDVKATGLKALQGLPAFRSAVRSGVDLVNQDLSVIEKVRQFAFADEAFTIENEEMTPSLKIRRHKLKDRYGKRLDGLYKA